MNGRFVIPLVVLLTIKLIGTSVFLLCFSQIFPPFDLPLPPATTFSGGSKDCATRWIFYEGKCYFFSAQDKTWDDSQANCAQSNSHLVVVNDIKELAFLMSNTKNENYFIGLRKSSSNQRWSWTDNSRTDLNLFNIHQYVFNCAVVGLNSLASMSCSVPSRWICEKNA